MRFSGSFLREEEVAALCQAVAKTLTEVGVQFQHEEALALFHGAGASVSGDRVRIPETLLQKTLATVPNAFIVKGKSAEYDCPVGKGTPVLAGASGPVFARSGGTRRLATTEDFINLLKLTETSKAVSICNYIIVEPQDMPEEKRKLFQVASALKYSHKPLIGITLGKGRTAESLQLIREFYGDGEAGPYRAIGIISPISPLAYDGGMASQLIEYAKNGQPVMIAACSQPGATSPVTPAGTLVIDTAEVLAGIVLAQIVKPGLPVIMGATSTACDLRYVSPAIGSPETGLFTLAFKSLCNHYHIPCRSGGSLTDAKVLDMQAGIEAAMTMLPAVLGDVDFILHACGVMDSFNTVCLEKFLIDEELAEAVLRMKRGFAIDAESLALAQIAETGPAGSFLMSEHTMEHCREGFMSTLFSREAYQNWLEGGSKDVEQRAAELLAKRLAAFRLPKLSGDQQKLLEKYLEGLV